MPAVAAQSAGITTVPSPVGGVNFFDSLFGMPPEDAIRLTNWWPQAYGCTHRKGYRDWAVNLGGSVGSLMSYHTATKQSKLYAVANGKMFDVTSADTVYPPPARTPVYSSLVGSLWQSVSVSNPGGTHLVAFSGQDDGIWIHQTSPPAIVYDRIAAADITGGLDPKNVIDCTIHQHRLWMVQRDSCLGWYTDTDQIKGPVSKYDFGPLFPHGGFLQSLATWTVDSGTGSDDLLVAFGSEGDVAVYQGTNPNSLSTWALKGVYYVGPLLQGNRFHCKVLGDLKFISQQGLISMNSMLTSDTAPQNTVEASKIQQFLSEQATLYGFLPGWDIKFMAAQNMLIINIPSVIAGGTLQLVENVVSGKWTTFLGMDADVWMVDYQTVPFFGDSNGRVLQAWTGTADEVTISNPVGLPITALAQQAYNYFGTPGNNKQVGIYRPNFLTDKSVSWKSEVVYDFRMFTPLIQVNAVAAGLSRWDSAIWDRNNWAGGLRAQKEWASAEGIGYAGSLAIATKSDGEVVWVNTDYTVTTVGVL